jgi:pentatricopeptide repeat protein
MLNGFMRRREFQLANTIYLQMRSHFQELNEFNVYISI